MISSARQTNATHKMDKNLVLILLIAVLVTVACHAQHKSPIAKLNVEYQESFDGFDLLDVTNKNVFIIAEDTHNRISMPRTTLKFLRYLYQVNGTRVLAIEAGTSTAWLINKYLANQDTLLLNDIIRHTFYWGIEHREFLQELAKWNQQLDEDRKIRVVSADIELKQESVVLALNVLMEKRAIPLS